MEPRDLLSEHDRVELKDPVMIAAFRGWNDAGEAASFASSHLAREWSASRFATIDPEEFYDFQDVRPQVELEGGLTRKIVWPSNEFWAARRPERDVILLVGTEPNTHWRTFCDVIVSLAHDYDVKLVITLGALLADIPHSRPVHITGTAADGALVERLGLQRSRYEGPTGIVGVLHNAFATEGIDSASLWAAVPHYLAVSPNPKAALALVKKTTELIAVPAAASDLEDATAVYEERVTEMVAADEDVQHYVHILEERSDEREQESFEGPIEENEIPTGDALAAELENYLRDHREGNSS
jgi:proteasome assembly chaperone (PAC2) family protein